MATFTTNRTAYGATSAVSGIFAFLSRMSATVAAWNDVRITRNALASLSDRELDDIGLSRYQIDSVINDDFIR